MKRYKRQKGRVRVVQIAIRGPDNSSDNGDDDGDENEDGDEDDDSDDDDGHEKEDGWW